MNIQSLISQACKFALTSSSILVLSACVGKPTTAPEASSSSLNVETSSSVASVPSSSSIAPPSSLPNSSSPSSSSSLAPSSSSIAPSSSSVAISSAPISSSVPASSSQPSSASSSVASNAVSVLTSSGTFDSGAENFIFSFHTNVSGDTSFTNDEADIMINQPGDMVWNIQVLHDVAVTQDQQYTLCFDAKADGNRTILFDIDQGPEEVGGYGPLTSVGTEVRTVPLTTSYQSFKQTFNATATDLAARLAFNLGLSDIDVQLDNIGLYEGAACGGNDSGQSSSSSVASSASSAGNATIFKVGDTVEAELFNPNASSNVVKIFEATAGPETYLGGFDLGASICLDNIDLTGVKSIDMTIARNGGDIVENEDVRGNGRFAIMAGGGDYLKNTILAEKITTTTNGWENFETVNVGLDKTMNGVTQLCFLGLDSFGIFNLDKFTLSEAAGTNDSLGVPSGPAVAPISVRGNQIFFGDKVDSIAGNSFFWSTRIFKADRYYTDGVVSWLKQDWGSQLVRAALTVDDTKDGSLTPFNELGGYITEPYFNKSVVRTVAHSAIKNGMYVIIDWHAHKAEDHEAEAIEFFKAMATEYGQFNNVIYEIYNEPINTPWPTIKGYAERVIAEIRKIDPDNLIIVGTRFFSQEVEEAADNPILEPGTNQLAKNVAYTLHFYAGTHRNSLRQKAQRALDKGIALFVTEWGTTPASGFGEPDLAETALWMDFLKQNNISHANWAINGVADDRGTLQGSSANKEGSSFEGNWSESDLTTSGKAVRDIIKNW